MKIQKTELKYFKFHKNLIIDFDAKNLLIFGENGTGKSSFYEALYSNFYHQKSLDKYIASKIQETYRSRGCEAETLEVNITFDGSKLLNRSADELSDFNILRVEKARAKGTFNYIEPTIYFANEKVLNRLTKENFYIALNETLFEHFPQMKSIYSGVDENHHFKRYAQFNNLSTLKKKIIDKIGNDDVDEIRAEFEKIVKSENELLEYVFANLFPIKEVNKIIKTFDETFEISFVITPAQSGNSEVLELNPPIIKIKIDDIECDGKLSNHFNEAKLKLIGVAIYFALAKKYEASENGFKLLVLDDFLTSLDMANRKLIMKYILEEFKDYQKLILTHNLQFFNMSKKMIHLDSEDAKQWKIQKLFVYDNQAFLYDKNISYLDDANERLSQGDEHSAGNFIRKEFERVVNEFEQLLELGIVEESKNIINTLESQDRFYLNASKNLNLFCEEVHRALNCPDPEQRKLCYIKAALSKALQTQVNFEEKIKNSDGTESVNTIRTTIKKGKFYQNFILHSASHNDISTEIYKKECENAIKILQDLNKVINRLKGTKYE